MADQVGGFAGGYMQAQESQDAHNLNMQSMAKGNLEIKQTQMMLDAQTAAMMDLKHVGQSGPAQGAGGSQVSGVAGQSYKASELAFAAGDSYMRHGMLQQGSEFMEKGAKLAESGAALEKQQAEQQQKMWTHVGSALETVHENSPTAKADWDKARMTFPLMFPEEAKHPEIQKFLSKPYDPQTVDLLKKASVSAADQAERKKTEAQAKGEAAAARFADAGVGMRKAEEREHNARATAIGKAGGKPPPQAEVNNAKSLIQADYPQADPKGYQLYATEIAERAKQLMAADMSRDQAFQQAYQEVNDSGKLKNLPNKPDKQTQAKTDLRAEVVSDIDQLIESMGNTDMAAAGLKGKVNRAAEWASTTTGLNISGSGQDTPITDITAQANLIHQKLQKAISGTAYGKDRQALNADLADLTKIGVSDKTYVTKLRAIQKNFNDAAGKTIQGKGDKTAAVQTATGPGGKKLYLRDGKWVDK